MESTIENTPWSKIYYWERYNHNYNRKLLLLVSSFHHNYSGNKKVHMMCSFFSNILTWWNQEIARFHPTVVLKVSVKVFPTVSGWSGNRNSSNCISNPELKLLLKLEETRYGVKQPKKNCFGQVRQNQVRLVISVVRDIKPPEHWSLSDCSALSDFCWLATIRYSATDYSNNTWIDPISRPSAGLQSAQIR